MRRFPALVMYSISSIAGLSLALLLLTSSPLTRLSRADAETLHGASTPPQFETYDYFENQYCVEILDCQEQSCSAGGEFDCGLFVTRHQTNLTLQFFTAKCERRAGSEGCLCEQATLRYTCSNVFAGCYYDEEEEECLPNDGFGFQLAPQSCRSVCPPVSIP